MSERNGGLNVLVVTGDQSLGTTVAEAVETTEIAANAQRVEAGTDALGPTTREDIDGAIVDDQVSEPATVVDQLTDRQAVPVVVLADQAADNGTITRAIEAGATDVFPRAQARAQYELVFERLATASGDSTPRADTTTDDQPYRDVFENASDGLVIHEPDTGEMLEVNDRFCELTGYSADELLGETVNLVIADDEGYSYEEAKTLIQRARDEGPQLFEWRQERKDGQTSPVEVHLTLVEIHGKERVLGSVRDITAQKQREREFKQIFNSVNDTIAIHDRETGELRNVNQRMCELTGYSKEQLLELGAEGLVVDHPEQDYAPDEIPDIIDRVMAGEEIPPYEQALETSDGDLLWVEVNPTRAVVGGEERFLAISRDITERRRREREYEQIFNSVQDGLQIMDPETLETLDVNDAYLDMFGYDTLAGVREAGVEGMSLTEEGFTVEQGREIHQRVQETGDSEIVEWRAETEEGEPIWLELKVTPGIIGGEERNIVVHRDITERKYREQRLEVFNRILRHNLRNQLDVVRSHAETLAERDSEDHAERIIAAVDQLAAIGSRARKIDQVMSMGETVERVALDELLGEVVAALEPTRNDVAVTTELSAAATVTTNEEAVRIAAESALENAIEHAESAVRVDIDDCPDGYSIIVDDDGPGIPEDQLVPIQARTETNLQHGRGLGLWQLRWSVDKLNGELFFDTADGTTVRIDIPDQDVSTQLE